MMFVGSFWTIGNSAAAPVAVDTVTPGWGWDWSKVRYLEEEAQAKRRRRIEEEEATEAALAEEAARAAQVAKRVAVKAYRRDVEPEQQLAMLVDAVDAAGTTWMPGLANVFIDEYRRLALEDEQMLLLIGAISYDA